LQVETWLFRSNSKTLQSSCPDSHLSSLVFLGFWRADTPTVGHVIRSLGNARSLAVCRMSCATWAPPGSPPQSRQS
jgi:hypothetical protein